MQKRDLEKWYRLDYCLKAVERNGDALQYVNREFWHLFKDRIED